MPPPIPSRAHAAAVKRVGNPRIARYARGSDALHDGQNVRGERVSANSVGGLRLDCRLISARVAEPHPLSPLGGQRALVRAEISARSAVEARRIQPPRLRLAKTDLRLRFLVCCSFVNQNLPSPFPFWEEAPMPYCITFRSKSDAYPTGWYTGDNSRWSTDHKRLKLFDQREDAEPVAVALRELCPTNADNINVETGSAGEHGS